MTKVERISEVIARVSGLIRQNTIVTSVSTLVSASVLGQFIFLVTTPITSRLYTPEDFGLFAIFTAVLSLVLVGSSLRYELAIPLPKGIADARALLLLALLLNGLVAIAVALLVVPWATDLARLLNAPGLSRILWLLPLAVLGAGSYRAFNLWAVRHHDFHTLARTRILQSSINAALQIGCGLTSLGSIGLAIGHIFGLSAGTYALARGRSFTIGELRRQRYRLRIRALALRYHRFPKYDVAGATIDALNVQLPNLLLAALFNPAVAGHYMLADRILGGPLSLLSQSIGQVLYARCRRAVEEGNLPSLARRISLILALGMIVPVFIIIFFGEPLFAYFFGDAWREAGQFARWLMLGLAGQFLFASISLLLMATDGQHINFIVHLAMLITKAGALLYGYALGSPIQAIMAVAIVNLLGYVSATVAVVWHVKRDSIARSRH